MRQPATLSLLAHEVLDDGSAVAEHEGDGHRHRVHPDVEDREAAERDEREDDAESGHGKKRAEGAQAHHEGTAGEGRHHGERRGQRPRDLADRVSVHEGLERVRVDLDPRHVAAARERRREQIVEDRAGGPDEDDLVLPVLARDLAAHDPVV